MRDVEYINIDIERVRLRMSYADLAEKLGVNRRTIYEWITGSNIPVGQLVKMSELFGCSIDYLLGLTEVRKRAS